MGIFTRDHQATNMISLLLLAGAVAAHPYYYMPYAGLQGRAEPNADEATARYLINFGVFQMATATAAAVGTSGVSGTVRIFQNPFISNDDSRYTIEIVGMAAGTNYWVCLLPTNVQTSTTPVITDFVTAGRCCRYDHSKGLAQRSRTFIPTVQPVHSEGLEHRVQHRRGLRQEGRQRRGRRHLQQSLRWHLPRRRH